MVVTVPRPELNTEIILELEAHYELLVLTQLVLCQLEFFEFAVG